VGGRVVRSELRLIGELPSGTPVAFEAAFGWSWLADLLEDYGFEAHLVHPLRCKAIASARLKNDKVDAAILAQLLRADLLPEAWIAPAKVRQLRALLRHRISLVRLSTQLRPMSGRCRSEYFCTVRMLIRDSGADPARLRTPDTMTGGGGVSALVPIRTSSAGPAAPPRPTLLARLPY
jgi:Transposase